MMHLCKQLLTDRTDQFDELTLQIIGKSNLLHSNGWGRLQTVNLSKDVIDALASAPAQL